MKRFTLFCLLAVCLSGLWFAAPAPVQAQEENTGPIFDLTDAARANSRNLNRWLGVSVSLTLEQLKENNLASADLKSYAQGGGVVFLHTDAASLFGYVTVPAAQVLQGPVAVAQGLPLFGAHPLLSVSGDCDFTARIPGIHEIVFTPGDDDVLVVGHPTATPLMWIEGVQTPDGRPVYALAIAPVGRGWAIFSPYAIEKTAQGPLLIDNLRKFARPAGLGYIPLSLQSIFSATDQGDLGPLKNELQGAPPQATPTLPRMSSAPARKGLPNDPDQAPKVAFPMFLQDRDDQTSLPLAPGEAESLLQAIGKGDGSVNGLLRLLRARAEYSRGNFDQAQRWLENARINAPDQPAIQVWGAILAIHAIEDEDFVLDPKIRASRLDRAARIWKKAVDTEKAVEAEKAAKANGPAEEIPAEAAPVEEPPIVNLPATLPAVATANPDAANPVKKPAKTVAVMPPVHPEKERFVGGVSCDVLTKWSQGATRAVPFGPLTPSKAIEIRGQQSRFMLRAEQKNVALVVLAQALKSIADENEVPMTTSVLFFPDDQSYRGYAVQAGLQNGPSIKLLMSWYYTQHLEIMPPMNDKDEQRFRNDLTARLTGKDRVLESNFLKLLIEIHARTLVRSGSSVQVASDFFGPVLFEKIFVFFRNL